MNPVLSLCNSLSMNKQVFVPGRGGDCGHRGRGGLTVCQILRPDTRPPSAPPPHQLEVTQTLHFQTTRESHMAPHSSTLAWKIPWMEEPGRL